MKAKRLLSLILTVAMLLSVAVFPAMTASAAESLVLTDIDASVVGEKVSSSVTRLVSRGIINGYPDNTYRPNHSISRAEFCVVMVKFEAQQDYINPDALTGFEDLDTDANYAWARPYVAKAVELGIINGFEDKTFRAADPVTYEQAIKMLVCALGYENDAKIPTIANDWSSGYIAKAMNLRITSGTSIANKTAPTTRGTVAVLVSNALDVDRNVSEELPGWNPGNADESLGYEEIKGVVTGTFLTELEYADSSVPRNCIQIDDELYEIGFSADPNEFLGCEVEAVVQEEGEDNDYPVVVNMKLTSKTNILEIEAGLVGEFADGVLEYQTKREGNYRDAKIDEDYITIFNNKLYDYEIEKLSEELVNGNVVLVDNNGDKKYDVIRINSYDVFVVASKNSTNQKITLMYDAVYEGEGTIVFPAESTSIIFSLTRNGKEIKFSDISKWDVLNIKASPEDAEGKRYYEVVVTRETVSGNITERDANDESAIVIGGEEYYIADSLLEYIAQGGEDAPTLAVGENAQVYLDAAGKIVAAAEAKNTVSGEKYAYLYALRQNSDDSEYDLEFKLYTTDGKFIQIGSASKIKIDETKYKALDEDILEYLEKSAAKANENYETYMDDVSYSYQQPVIYQTNSDGLIATMYTVLSTENEDISMVMSEEDSCHVAYDPGLYDAEHEEYTGIAYSSSSKSFGKFKVSSSTKIIFVPDNRNSSDEYVKFNYSKAFSNGRKYHVEAFGLTSSKTAALVLMYHQNDSRIYTSSSPWMIVTSKSDTKDGTVIKGYYQGTYTMKSVTVSEEDGPSSISDIGKGDIIRYIIDGNDQLIDYQIWFDMSDPEQHNPINDIGEAYATDEEDIEKRIVEIHSTSTTPRKDYPTATFRLQYGTVTELILRDDSDTVDDQSISISPYIIEDETEIEMGSDDTGFITEEIGSSVKVFSYDRGGRNSDVVKEADLSEILDYTNYGDDATRVVVYTGTGSLRMIYIIHE